MKILIDLDNNTLNKIKELAIKDCRSRKNMIETMIKTVIQKNVNES